MDIQSELKGSFLAGLFLVAPLTVTVLVLQFVLTRLSGLLNPVVEGTRLTNFTGGVEPAAQLLAAVLIALGITILGFLAQRTRASTLFDVFDRVFGLVPLVSVVYTGVRQVSNTLAERDTRYRNVVIVEYPRLGVYSLGFVTGDAPDEVAEIEGKEAYTVIVPHSPNPTAGHLIFVPADRVHEADMSVRKAIRLVVTTGIAETEEEFVEFQESVGEGDIRAEAGDRETATQTGD